MTIGKIKEFVTDTNEIKGKTWNPHGSLIDEHQFHWLLDNSLAFRQVNLARQALSTVRK
jgi:hypothetical protein